MTLEKQKTTIIFTIPALLMLTAFFANLFAEGWNWSPSDFIIAGALLSEPHSLSIWSFDRKKLCLIN